jgi:hypothetical protein
VWTIEKMTYRLLTIYIKCSQNHFLVLTIILAGQETKQAKMRISIPLMILSSMISFGGSSTPVRLF